MMKGAKKFNVWIAQVSLNNRKSCKNCWRKLEGDNCNLSVGDYRNGKYRSAFYVCKECIAGKLDSRLHAGSYNLCYRSGQPAIAWVEQFKQTLDTTNGDK